MLTRSILAATVTLFAGVALSGSASAAQKPYQVTKSVSCSGFGCTVTFDALRAPVLLKHVACQFSGNGYGRVIVTLDAHNKVSTDTELPQVTDLGSLPFSGELYAVNSSAFLFGDAGSYYSFTAGIDTTLTLQCTLSGEYIDTKTSAT